MKHDRFVDTSGFYALLVKRDDMHLKAKEILNQASRRRTCFVTTDYVLDETATLLRARGLIHLVQGLFNAVFESRACRVEWMDQDRFLETVSFFAKHADQSWSFTDCFSFVVMKELDLTEVLTKDNHFKEAGFAPLLA